MKTTTPGTIFVLAHAHWHFSWQNLHEISVKLAERGYNVIFVEPLPLRWWPGWSRIFAFINARLAHKPELIGGHEQKLHPGIENVWLTGVPDQFAVGRYLNRNLFMPRMATQLRIRKLPRPLIVINFLPVSYSCALQNELQPDVCIYACTDSFQDMPGFRHVKLFENELVSNSDLVFTTSQSLYARFSERHSRLMLLLPGVDYPLFENARVERERKEPPLCAYFGTLRKEDNDVDLLRKISHQYRLKIIGLVKDPLEGFSNTTKIVSPVPINQLGDQIAEVDVLLLPYVKAEQTRFITPAKTFQCLATGKPVVSIGLPGLAWLSKVIYLCETHEEFLDAIESAGIEPRGKRKARLALAEANSWDSRVADLENQITEILESKRPGG